MNDEILTVAEAATYLKVSKKTVINWIKSDRLIASLVGRVYRIKRSDIDACLATNSNRKRGVSKNEC